MQQLDDWERHLILYAKSHYQRSPDVFADLRKIWARCSMIEEKFLGDNLIYFKVAEVFLKFAQQREVEELFKRMFEPIFITGGQLAFRELNRETTVRMIEILDKMIGYLSVVRVRHDPKGPLLMDLGRPDPAFLPLRT